MTRKLDGFEFILRSILGLVLLFAAVPKIADPASFAESIAAYQLLPLNLVTLPATLLPWLELLLGLALLSGCWLRAAAGLTSLLFLVFAALVLQATLAGKNIDCGCFAFDSKVSLGHVFFNSVCALSGAWLTHRGAGAYSLDRKLGLERSSWTTLAILLALSLPVASVGLAYHKGVADGLRSARGSGARLAFEPPNLDFGKLEQGEKRERKVRYTNTGSEPLTITKSESTCGCTIPKLSKFLLKPGESGEMTVRYTAGTVAGPFNKRVKLTHDGASEPQSIEVRGFVERTVIFQPNGAIITPGSPQTVKMVRRDKPFRILRVTSPVDELRLSYRQVAANAWELLLEADQPLPPPTSGRTHRVEILTDVTEQGFHFSVVGAPPK